MQDSVEVKLAEISGAIYKQNAYLVGMHLRDAVNVLSTMRSITRREELNRCRSRVDHIVLNMTPAFQCAAPVSKLRALREPPAISENVCLWFDAKSPMSSLGEHYI